MTPRSRGPGAVNAGASRGKPNGSERGYNTKSPQRLLALERSNAHAAIEVAKAKHPSLCRYGMVWEPDQTCDERFSVAGVATAIIYLRQFSKGPPRWSSYGLKHFAEDWGRTRSLEPYIANGEMICACVYLGLPISWSGNSPNVSVGVRLPRGYIRRAMDGVVD